MLRSNVPPRAPRAPRRPPGARAFVVGLAGVALLAACGERRAALPHLATDPDSIPEAFARSTAALAWPGATRAFQITPEGDLTNGDWTLRVRPACGAIAEAPRAIAFEGRWLPVAHWRRRAGGVRWDFEAAALPEAGAPAGAYRDGPVPAPRDTGLFVTLEIRATNTGPSACDAALELELVPVDSTTAFLAADAPLEPPALSWGGPSAAEPLVHAWSDAPAAGRALHVTWLLAAAETRTLRLVLPAYPTPPAALAGWAQTAHARLVDEARRHWWGEVERAARFELGDPEVEDALRAALVLLLAGRERRGDRWLPIGNPLHYRDVWLRDGARVIQALAVMGRTVEARAMAASLIAYQWPNGAFVSQRGQLDGTGHALWAIEQAWLRPRPRAVEVAALAASAWRAVRWIEWQRGLGRAAGLPFGAMLPFAEPNDNEMARAQLVGTDAWGIAACRAAARLLDAAGRGDAADSAAAALARYRADFDSALRASGAPDIPPSWQNRGRDWGNLNAVWPCGALDAGDARSRALARRVWDFAGGPGLAAYATPDSLHGYAGADLATAALLDGRRGEADSVLAALLAWRTASGGAAEIFSRTTRDYGRNLPPHATSAAALLALARNALVHDDDDTLRLTMGARARWWRGARVTGAPTRFGVLDLRFARGAGEASWEWTPVAAWTALSLPPGTTLAGTPAAPLVAGRAGRVALAPPGTRSARVAIAAAPEAP